MDQELLASSLSSAVADLGEFDWSDGLRLALLVHRDGGEYPAIQRLIEELRAQPDLAMFDGKMQVMPSRATRVEISNLAMWLMRRAAEVGAATAIGNLEQYLNTTEIPFSKIWALGGLKVDGSYDLGNSIRLCPWEEVPESNDKEHVCRELLLWWQQPSATLIESMSIPKVYVDGNDYKLPAEDDTNVRDTLHCIGVVGPFAPEILVSWLSAPAWAPSMGIGFTMPHTPGRPRGDTWTTDHAREVICLLESFRALNPRLKDLLRLASERLNTAMRRISPVDAAIDLGIALESLFLNDLEEDRGELTFRLRLRISRYLEQDPAQREDLFRLAGDLYGLRSTAVHTGRSPQQVRGQSPSALLEDGYRLAARAIRRFTKEGSPDWKAVQLS